jgi:hypothetical protein
MFFGGREREKERNERLTDTFVLYKVDNNIQDQYVLHVLHVDWHWLD